MATVKEGEQRRMRAVQKAAAQNAAARCTAACCAAACAASLERLSRAQCSTVCDRGANSHQHPCPSAWQSIGAVYKWGTDGAVVLSPSLLANGHGECRAPARMCRRPTDRPTDRHETEKGVGAGWGVQGVYTYRLRARAQPYQGQAQRTQCAARRSKKLGESRGGEGGGQKKRRAAQLVPTTDLIQVKVSEHSLPGTPHTPLRAPARHSKSRLPPLLLSDAKLASLPST